MGLPAALMANFIAWREERQILLPQGGIRMTCHSASSAQSADLFLPTRGRATHIEDEHVFCVNRIVHDSQHDTTDVAKANCLAVFDGALRQREVLAGQVHRASCDVCDVKCGVPAQDDNNGLSLSRRSRASGPPPAPS